jgi:hypothetical protein
MMLFRMVEILFGLFVENSNEELRRTSAILFSSQNSKITVILTISEQQIYIWIHICYSYSENNNYSAIRGPSKHTRISEKGELFIYYFFLAMAIGQLVGCNIIDDTTRKTLVAIKPALFKTIFELLMEYVSFPWNYL